MGRRYCEGPGPVGPGPLEHEPPGSRACVLGAVERPRRHRTELSGAQAHGILLASRVRRGSWCSCWELRPGGLTFSSDPTVACRSSVTHFLHPPRSSAANDLSAVPPDPAASYSAYVGPAHGAITLRGETDSAEVSVLRTHLDGFCGAAVCWRPSREMRPDHPGAATHTAESPSRVGIESSARTPAALGMSHRTGVMRRSTQVDACCWLAPC
jgi:hypothetical protein